MHEHHGRMIPKLSNALAIVALLLCAWPAVASAAAQEEVAAAPTLRLVAPQAMGGRETFITIMLDAVPGQPLQSIKAEIEFSTAELSFVSSRLAFAGELADATLEVTERTASDKPAAGAQPVPTGRACLVVTVVAKKPIPTGPVAEMRMQVAQGVTETEARLGFRGEAFDAQDVKAAKLDVAEPDPLRITSAPPQVVPKVFACFFYMH